jgi:hypothetical protein
MDVFLPFQWFHFSIRERVMKKNLLQIVAAGLCVSMMAGQAVASLITLTTTDNLATTATVAASSENTTCPLVNATNLKLTDGIPGEDSFDDMKANFIFTAASSYTLDLTWSKAVNLTSLQAYVCHGNDNNSAITDADRNVSAIQFYVNQGAGFASVGSVNTANTNDIGCFDLTKLDGNWSNVTAIRCEFISSWGEEPRVGEVLAIGQVASAPEPSSAAILGAAVVGFAAYAWRKRK